MTVTQPGFRRFLVPKNEAGEALPISDGVPLSIEDDPTDLYERPAAMADECPKCRASDIETFDPGAMHCWTCGYVWPGRPV